MSVLTHLSTTEIKISSASGYNNYTCLEKILGKFLIASATYCVGVAGQDFDGETFPPTPRFLVSIIVHFCCRLFMFLLDQE